MYKSKLQELCHQYSWNLPDYTTVKDGPDHNPRFSASVSINGINFQTQADQCRSSKEAQNQAAKLAIDHFTAPKHILQRSPNSTPLFNSPVASSSSGVPTSNSNLDIAHANSGILQPAQHENVLSLKTNETPPGFNDAKRSKGFPASNINLHIGPANGGTLLPSQLENVRTLQINGSPLGLKDDKNSKDMLHLYKNRLQNYAQKRNLALPMYSCEISGPPHARSFKSTVTINGKPYETSIFFSTLKEAEHAAAKVAFESLSLNEIQEDEGLYKSLLQELAQKEGFHFPAYHTAKSGPPHLPTFVSTVEIGSENFQGQEGKTKKQAEMNAAKAAYTAFTERRARRDPTVLSLDCHIKGALELSSSILQSVVTNELQPNVRPKASLLIQEEQPVEDKETDINSKGHGCSSSSDVVYAHLRDPFPSTSPKDGPSLPSTPSEYYTNSVMESDIETTAGTNNLVCHKILVCPSKPNITFPDGATVLPFSDDKWMAVRVDMNQNQ